MRGTKRVQTRANLPRFGQAYRTKCKGGSASSWACLACLSRSRSRRESSRMSDDAKFILGFG